MATIRGHKCRVEVVQSSGTVFRVKLLEAHPNHHCGSLVMVYKSQLSGVNN